jgi:hypothetical protein
MYTADDILRLLETYGNPYERDPYRTPASASTVGVAALIDYQQASKRGASGKPRERATVEMLPPNKNTRRALEGDDFEGFVNKRVTPNLPRGYTLEMIDDKSFAIEYPETEHANAHDFLYSVGLNLR